MFQLIIFVLTFIYRIFTLNQINLAEEAVIPLKYFDIVSRDYAITIGFLGTVLSIWIALEVEGMDYSNFFQILFPQNRNQRPENPHLDTKIEFLGQM